MKVIRIAMVTKVRAVNSLGFRGTGQRNQVTRRVRGAWDQGFGDQEDEGSQGVSTHGIRQVSELGGGG